MTYLRFGMLACLLGVGLTACTPTRLPPSGATSSAGLQPEAVIKLFDQRWQGVEELRTLARVSITSARGRYHTRQTFLWHRPDRLRLDVLSLFGQPLLSLTAEAAQASIYYPSQGTFFHGPANADTLARVIGLPLEVDEVAPLLMGDIRPGPEPPVSGIALETDRGMHLLRFLGPGGILLQDAWIDPEHLVARRVLRYSQDGTAAADVTYRDFQDASATFPAPRAVVVWLPRPETEVDIQFQTVDVNPHLSPAVFQLTPPHGVRISPLPYP